MGDKISIWKWAYDAGYSMAKTHGHLDHIGAFQIADHICRTNGWAIGRDMDRKDPARIIWGMVVTGALAHMAPQSTGLWQDMHR